MPRPRGGGLSVLEGTPGAACGGGASEIEPPMAGEANPGVSGKLGRSVSFIGPSDSG